VRVLWKPPGWIVAEDAGAGGACSLGAWVSQRFGPQHPIALDGEEQYGLVHRLDKDTSGAVLLALDYRRFYAAQLQFVIRKVQKRYVCLCHGRVPAVRRSLEAPLRVLRHSAPLRSVVALGGAPSCTEICAVGHLLGPQGGFFSLVEVLLHTGRTHQIRAHLANDGHPLVADSLYGGTVTRWCERTFLHAHRLAVDEIAVDISCSLPGDLQDALWALEAADARSRAMLAWWLDSPTR